MPRRAIGVIVLASLVSACSAAPGGRGTSPAVATPSATDSPAPATATPAPTTATPAPTVAPAAKALPSSVPTPELRVALATHVVEYHAAVLAATKAIPGEVAAGRKAHESLDSYGKRAQGAATAAAQPLRELVRRELAWLDSLDGAPCPAASGFRTVLNAYAIVAGATWTAHYAPDAALLRQALSDLDGLNASVAAAVAKLSDAPDACDVEFGTTLGVLPGTVIGTQSIDIRRDPARLHESALGDLVADAMRDAYPQVAAAIVNSGGLRADLVVSPPSAGERPGEITLGEMLTVLPFGDRTVILTVTGEQLEAALLNGFGPFCDPSFTGGTFRFPQVSGLKVRFDCDGATPVVDGTWRTRGGAGGSLTPIDAADTLRLVTNDYMFAGGDGYSMLAAATDVDEPGDTLLDVAIDYIAAHAPVAPVVDGRILGP